MPNETDAQINAPQAEIDSTDYSNYQTGELLDLLNVRVLDENIPDDPRRAFNRSQPGQASIFRITDDLKRRMLLNDTDTSNQIRIGVDVIYAKLSENHVSTIRVSDARALANIFTAIQR